MDVSLTFNGWLISIVLLIMVYGNAEEKQSSYYRLETRYPDRTPLTGMVFDHPINLFTCFLICTAHINCTSIYYISSAPPSCKGYFSRVHSSSFIQPVSGQYYENVGPEGNIALGKPAFQTSTSKTNHEMLALDGKRYESNIEPNQTKKSCSITSRDDDTPSFTVDFLGTYTITSFALLSRYGCCDKRMANLKVSVGQTANETNQLCYFYPGPGFRDTMLTFECTRPVTGRFLKIAKTKRFLSICELEVYGYLVD